MVCHGASASPPAANTDLKEATKMIARRPARPQAGAQLLTSASFALPDGKV